MSMWDKVVDWLERRLNLSEMFSWITTFGLSYAPLNPNAPVREVIREAFLKPLPAYQWPQALGFLLLVTFLVEIITGLLLAFYFQPAEGVAYESTRLIIRDTHFGWYIHQMHYWGAQLLIFLLILRLLRLFFHRVYEPPRELLWSFGWIILVLSIQACFTGKLLPWSQDSYWGTLRGLELLIRIPLVGTMLRYFAGGFSVDGFLLHRFYLLHIIFIPMLMFFFIYLNFATIRKIGFTQTYVEAGAMRPVFPRHVMNLLMMLLILFGLMLTLSVFMPASFLEQADPYSTPAGVAVPWYLLPMFGAFHILPAAVAGWVIFVVFWAVLFLPFLGRKDLTGGWLAIALRWVGIAVVLFFIYATYLGYKHRG